MASGSRRRLRGDQALVGEKPVQELVARRAAGIGGDLVDIGLEALVDAEKAEEPGKGAPGAPSRSSSRTMRNPLAGKQREVAAQVLVVGVLQDRVGADRLGEGAADVRGVVALVHLERRAGAVDRVAQRRDDPRIGQEVVDARRRLGMAQVVHRRLADRVGVPGLGEERLVFLAALHRVFQPVAAPVVAEERGAP